MKAEGRHTPAATAYTVFFGARSLWQTTSRSPASGVPWVRSWKARTSRATSTRASSSRTATRSVEVTAALPSM